MRTAIMITAVFSLAACDRAAEKAEREFAIVSDGSSRERCSAAAKAAAAWLERENAAKYQEWKLQRDVACLGASIDDPASDMPENVADELERQIDANQS